MASSRRHCGVYRGLNRMLVTDPGSRQESRVQAGRRAGFRAFRTLADVPFTSFVNKVKEIAMRVLLNRVIMMTYEIT